MTANGAPVIAVPRSADGCAWHGDGDRRGEPGGERHDRWRDLHGNGEGQQWVAVGDQRRDVGQQRSTDLVISGTLSQVNTDLGTLKDTDNSAGPDTITLTASDSFGNAATPATIAVTASVTPVITVPGAQTLGINQLTAISGISLAESGNTGSETFTVTLVDSNGQLSATGGVQSNGGHTLTFSGLSLSHLEQRPWHAEGQRWHGGPGHYYRQCQRQLWQRATARRLR